MYYSMLVAPGTAGMTRSKSTRESIARYAPTVSGFFLSDRSSHRLRRTHGGSDLPGVSIKREVRDMELRGTTCTGVFGMFICPSTRNCIARYATALGCLIAVATLSGCESWSEHSINESKRRAEPIVAAIEAYIADHGGPPTTLDELVPKYITSIKPPTAGSKEWEYLPDERSFALSFGCGQDCYPCCTLSWAPDGSNWMMDH